MIRTRSRALPAGSVSPNNALRFGLFLALASFLVLTFGVNLLSALLTLSAFLFYVLVYTSWLKRSSVHNIVIGGAAGAVPPLVGWAAVTGELGLLSIYLFAIIFFWTPPHFWALSLLIKDEYARAGVPMLPVVRGDEETRVQILLYTLLLIGLSTAAFALGLLGPLYLAGSLILGVAFLTYALKLIREASREAARRLFRYSLLYLPLIFVVMIADRALSA